MSDNAHSFDIYVAYCLNGHVQKAILLKEIHGWCVVNAQRNRNIRHGIVWTYNTSKELSKKFFYMPQGSIARWLKELEKDGWIYSGNFNEKGYDRTKWYTINFELYEKAKNTPISQNDKWVSQNDKWVSQIEQWVSQNDKWVSQIEQPIPSLTNSSTSLKKKSINSPNIKKQRLKKEEKNSAKKEKKNVIPPPTDYGYQYKKKKFVKPKGANMSQLDINLDSKKNNLPEQWSSFFAEKVIDFWYYLEEKKGVNWGTVQTIEAQILTIQNYLKQYNEEQIIQSMKECIECGNSRYNPLWTIKRIEKEQHEQQKTINPSQPESKFGQFGESFIKNRN